MRIASSKLRTTFLEEFGTVLQKFNTVSVDHMLASQKMGLLKKAANLDNQLLFKWTAVETTFFKDLTCGIATAYEDYMEYLAYHTEKLEESGINNSGWKVNVMETNYMDSFMNPKRYSIQRSN